MTFYLKLRGRKNASTSSYAIGRTNTKNCLSCTKHAICSNPNKSFDFICSRYDKRSLNTLENFNVNHLFDTDGKNNLILPAKLSRSGNQSDLDNIHVSNDEELNNLLNRITKEFSSGLPRDLKIDDGDLPLAANFVDWSYNKKFIGNDEPIYPFPKQIQIITTFFTEWCYNPHCTDIAYAMSIPVDATIDDIQNHITFLEFGKCSKCKQTRLDIWNNPSYKAKRFTDMIGISGQRSGKTSAINRLNGYHIHRMFKLARPQKVFGIEEDKWIENSFTATTFAKAVDNFYDPLVFQFKNNPWFKNYLSMLDYYGQKYGEQLYKILGETSYFRHRNYQFYPQSPDPANLRGATRALVAVDELAHLYAQSDTAKKLNPAELHKSLRNSLFTLRNAYTSLVKKGYYDLPPAIMCNVTSPRSMSDFAMKLYQDAMYPSSTTYGFHYSVYQFNPNIKEDDPELLEIKRTDPEGFKRDFLAIAPSAHNAFIDDKNIIKGLVKDKHVNAIVIEPTYIRGHANNVKAMSARYRERINKKINKSSPKVMALDAGSKRNSFAITVGHLEVYSPEPDISNITKVIDILGEVIPKGDRIISFPDLYEEVLAPIIDDFNVIFITADRWNALHALQKASDDFDIPYNQYSLKFKDFLQWKGSVYSGTFWLPMPELKIDEAFSIAADNYPLCFEGKPVAHAMLQMLTVENLMNKTVEKGTNFTDDLFRSLVLCDYWLSNDELREELLTPTEPQEDPNAFIGVYSSGSGAITTLSGATVNTNSGTGGTSNNSNTVGAISSLLPFGR